jgi:hypothetical protein
MVEVENMLQGSFLICVPGQSSTNRNDCSSNSIQGEYLKILKNFLNLIYEPVLVKHKMSDEIDRVQAMTMMYLLKNKAILDDVWSYLDSQKSHDS